MQNKKRTSLKISAAFLGCVIGAGFASGQEVLIYFASYKQNGLLGIIISVTLFLVLLVSLNLYILKNKIINFKQFIYTIMSKRLSKIFYIIFFAFTYVTYGIMGSGFGAAINQHTGLNDYIGFIIYIVILSVVLLFDQKGVIYLNLILTPLMIIGILGLSLYSILNMHTSAFLMNYAKEILPFWIISAILYVGYNSITGIAVVCELGNYMHNKKTAIISAGISVFIFGLLLFVMYLPLSYNLENVMMFKIPMLYIATMLNNDIGRIYFFVLLMAMLTTGAGCGYVLCQGFNFSKKKSILVLNLASVVFMFFDFSQLVKNLYGFFGIFGIILIGIILYKTVIRERALKEKNIR